MNLPGLELPKEACTDRYKEKESRKIMDYYMMQNKLQYIDQHKHLTPNEFSILEILDRLRGLFNLNFFSIKTRDSKCRLHQRKFKTMSPHIKHHNTYLFINATKLLTQTKKLSSINGCCHPLQTLQNPILHTL